MKTFRNTIFGAALAVALVGAVSLVGCATTATTATTVATASAAVAALPDEATQFQAAQEAVALSRTAVLGLVMAGKLSQVDADKWSARIDQVAADVATIHASASGAPTESGKKIAEAMAALDLLIQYGALKLAPPVPAPAASSVLASGAPVH